MKSTAAITGHLLLVLQLLQAIDTATPASVIRCANGEYVEFEQLCGANSKTEKRQSENISGDNRIKGTANQPESVRKKCSPCIRGRPDNLTLIVREAINKPQTFGNLLTSYCVIV